MRAQRIWLVMALTAGILAIAPTLPAEAQSTSDGVLRVQTSDGRGYGCTPRTDGRDVFSPAGASSWSRETSASLPHEDPSGTLTSSASQSFSRQEFAVSADGTARSTASTDEGEPTCQLNSYAESAFTFSVSAEDQEEEWVLYTLSGSVDLTSSDSDPATNEDGRACFNVYLSDGQDMSSCGNNGSISLSARGVAPQFSGRIQIQTMATAYRHSTDGDSESARATFNISVTAQPVPACVGGQIPTFQQQMSAATAEPSPLQCPGTSVGLRDYVGYDGSVREGDPTVTFWVDINGTPLSDPLTVRWQTFSGEQFSAEAALGTDYNGLSGEVVFAPGEVSKPIDVPLVADEIPEPDEAFGVQLVGYTGVATITWGMRHAYAIVRDDDCSVYMPNAGGSNSVTVPADGGIHICGSIFSDEILAFGPSSSDDFIYGGAGYDELYGGAGSDTLFGGFGTDEIYGGYGGRLPAVDPARDRLSGGSGDNFLYGEEGDDELQGGNTRGFLYGGEGNDTIEGGAGKDYIYGGPSDGVPVGQTDDDTITAFGEVDNIYGYEGNDTISAGPENDRVWGGDGDDTIDGNSGDDELYGEDGKDELNGDQGWDHLYGGADDDLLHSTTDPIGIRAAVRSVLFSCNRAGSAAFFGTGSDGGGSMSGGPGRDTLCGARGVDVMFGGEDGDYLEGFGTEAGETLGDRYEGQEGNDQIEADNLDTIDRINGGADFDNCDTNLLGEASVDGCEIES